MSDRTKAVLRFIGTGVLWVYLLSIRLGEHTVFYHANDILVQNQIVEAIGRQCALTYDRVLAATMGSPVGSSPSSASSSSSSGPTYRSHRL